LPKSIAKKYNYSLGLLFAYPITLFKYATAIFVWPISKLFVLLGKLFKKRSKQENKIDEDVLTEMVDTIEEEGGLEEEEAEIVRSAIDLNDIKVFEIMTPRVDVYAIDIEDDIEEIMKEEELFIHSRIPIYEDTIDNIIGILPLKALLKAHLKNEKINIKELCYEPLFVPRSHQVLDLLEEFKTSKKHIAVILDEYGGTEGIVTMEDILEEIVGDIFDESDEIEVEYVEHGEGKYTVDGAMNIDDFFELIELKDEDIETDYTTVGGFCQEQLDKFCEKGDTFDFRGYTFTILEADKYTVEKIEVINNNYEPEEDE
jgi:CBS domain containing-hemolysin-like protein